MEKRTLEISYDERIACEKIETQNSKPNRRRSKLKPPETGLRQIDCVDGLYRGSQQVQRVWPLRTCWPT